MSKGIPGMFASVALFALVAACGSKTEEPGAAAPEADVSGSAPVPAEPAAPVQPASAPVPEVFAELTGDAAAGKTVFIQCQACHSLKEGENRVGPSLHKVIGATAGHVSDFRYSDANKGSGIVWTEEKLFEYLKNPRAMVPGTTMAFAGIADPQKRANLIAYLKANGGAG